MSTSGPKTNSTAFLISFLVSIFILFIFSLWFIGSSYFPIIGIKNQFSGESINVKWVVVTKPSILVIYFSENFPDLSEEIVRTTILTPGIYGNFDLLPFMDRSLPKGNYVAALYTTGIEDDFFDPLNTQIANDIFTRPIKSYFFLE